MLFSRPSIKKEDSLLVDAKSGDDDLELKQTLKIKKELAAVIQALSQSISSLQTICSSSWGFTKLTTSKPAVIEQNFKSIKEKTPSFLKLLIAFQQMALDKQNEDDFVTPTEDPFASIKLFNQSIRSMYAIIKEGMPPGFITEFNSIFNPIFKYLDIVLNPKAPKNALEEQALLENLTAKIQELKAILEPCQWDTNLASTQRDVFYKTTCIDLLNGCLGNFKIRIEELREFLRKFELLKADVQNTTPSVIEEIKNKLHEANQYFQEVCAKIIGCLQAYNEHLIIDPSVQKYNRVFEPLWKMLEPYKKDSLENSRGHVRSVHRW